MTHPILVTGAAGRVGGVGGLVVEALQRRGLSEFLVVIEIVAAKA
jgi:tRNA A37 threonylcarbamoyladenosine dehydratase